MKKFWRVYLRSLEQIIVILVCILLAATALSSDKQFRAVVVGVSEYPTKQPKLGDAASDVKNELETIAHNLDFKEENVSIELLIDRDGDEYTQPTLGNIWDALNKQMNRTIRGRKDVFVFYFTGHGTRYKDVLILETSGSKHSDNPAYALKYPDIVTSIESKSEADVNIMFIDACQTRKDFLGGEKPPISQRDLDLLEGKKIFAFFASKPGERAYINRDTGYGYFTESLLSGFKKADAENDTKPDGKITGHELYRYLRMNVAQMTRQADIDPPQSPKLVTGGSDIVINRLRSEISAKKTIKFEGAINFTTDQRKVIQEELNLRGYNTGTVDGLFGKKTRLAILGFQREQGWKATGFLTSDQWKVLVVKAKKVPKSKTVYDQMEIEYNAIWDDIDLTLRRFAGGRLETAQTNRTKARRFAKNGDYLSAIKSIQKARKTLVAANIEMRYGARKDDVIVSKADEASYKNIQEAIDNVPEGTRIRVGGGQYFETIKVTKPIELVGDNTSRAQIFAHSGATLNVTSTTGPIVIRGFEFHSEPGSDKIGMAAHIAAPDVLIEDTQFYSKYGVGVLIDGETRNLRFNNCVIDDVGARQKEFVLAPYDKPLHSYPVRGEGVLLIGGFGGGGATFSKCSIRNNESNGIYIDDFPRVFIKSSVISGNEGFGIKIQGDLFKYHGTVEIRGSDLRSNGKGSKLVPQGLKIIEENIIE